MYFCITQMLEIYGMAAFNYTLANLSFSSTGQRNPRVSMKTFRRSPLFYLNSGYLDLLDSLVILVRILYTYSGFDIKLIITGSSSSSYWSQSNGLSELSFFIRVYEILSSAGSNAYLFYQKTLTSAIYLLSSRNLSCIFPIISYLGARSTPNNNQRS